MYEIDLWEGVNQKVNKGHRNMILTVLNHAGKNGAMFSGDILSSLRALIEEPTTSYVSFVVL